ncbi:MAG: hypothetical protein HRT88_15990 [Lentisphaeraceae bacterium]|nr:hypothetical protein [Lentisphaeraceae bacterium]
MKSILTKTAAIIFLLLLNSCSTSSSIPADAVKFQVDYYKFFDAPVSWHEAAEQCKKMGGQLVSVKSKQVNDFIVKLIAGKCVWLGASDQIKEGEWRWRDGSKATYTNWAGHEPDNWYDGKEHWVVVGWPGYKSGEWGDTQPHSRKQINGFVCQWK